MPRKEPPASSYPQEFMQLFLQVIKTGQPIVIDNFGTESPAYTTLRAKMNRWRRTVNVETKESTFAKSLYNITCRVLQKEKGDYYLSLEPSSLALSQKLNQFVSPDMTWHGAETKQTNPTPAMDTFQGEDVISDLFKTKP